MARGLVHWRRRDVCRMHAHLLLPLGGMAGIIGQRMSPKTIEGAALTTTGFCHNVLGDTYVCR